MLELPEAYSISQQIEKTLSGKTIENSTYCRGMVKIELGFMKMTIIKQH